MIIIVGELYYYLSRTIDVCFLNVFTKLNTIDTIGTNENIMLCMTEVSFNVISHSENTHLSIKMNQCHINISSTVTNFTKSRLLTQGNSEKQ